MLVVAIGWQVYAIHRNPLDLGLVGLAEFVPLPVLALPAGQLADRVSRRLVVAVAARAAGRDRGRAARDHAGGGAPALAVPRASALLAGVASAIGEPGARALTPELVPPELLPGAVALRSVAGQIGVVVGPAVGGVIFAVEPVAVYVDRGRALRRRARRVACSALPRRAVAPGDEPVTGEQLVAGIRFICAPGCCSARSRSTSSPSCSATRSRWRRCSRGRSSTSARSGSARCEPRRRPARSSAGLLLARRPLPFRAGRDAARRRRGLRRRDDRLRALALAAALARGARGQRLRGHDQHEHPLDDRALVTPLELQGRVSAVEWVFISASNELGAFESGAVASLIGTVARVVAGGAVMIGVAASWPRLFPALARMGRLDELAAGARAGVGSLAWGAARPLDASGRTTSGGAAGVLLPALRQPDGGRGGGGARRARRRHRAPLPLGHGRGDRARPLAAAAGRHDRARGGRLLRHRRRLRRPRAVGTARRRVRPDRAAARRRPARLARGAVEPVPDDARPRGGRRPPGAVVVDSTVATPVHLRPLEHGADFVLHSATKYLAGHDDALLGAVVCRDAAAAEELRAFRGRTGIVAAPDPAWLLLRGLKTLELRVRRQTETAAVLAERLRGAPGGADRPLSRPRRAALLRRRRRRDGAAGRDLDAHDRQRHLARRRDEPDREPPPLGGRPRPARAAARSASGSRTRTCSGPTSSRRWASLPPRRGG